MKGIAIIEEHNLYCGFGSILARIISEKNPIQMKFLGVNNGLNYENVKEQIQDLL